jgi:hypothetical protein
MDVTRGGLLYSRYRRYITIAAAAVVLFDAELPEKRCVDLEYLLLSLPHSPWVITMQEVAEVEEMRELKELKEMEEDASTSLGEDIGVGERRASCGGRTRVGKFTGRRRL